MHRMLKRTRQSRVPGDLCISVRCGQFMRPKRKTPEMGVFQNWWGLRISLGLSFHKCRRDFYADSSAHTPRYLAPFPLLCSLNFSFVFSFLLDLNLQRDFEHHEQGSKQHQTSAEEVPKQHRGRHSTENRNWLKS